MPDLKNSSDSQNIDQLTCEENAKLCDDREFWDACISWLIDGETINPERAIKIADDLTEARRQRFPVQQTWISTSNEP